MTAPAPPGGQPVTVVTGASSGLGVDFARLAAADGHPLMLVARRADRLEALAATLRQDHGVAVTCHPADLADAAQRADLADRLAERPVATLVNNAGFGLRGRFHHLDPAEQSAMVAVNIAAVTELARAVAPGMVARRAGGILNVASTAALQPGPGMAVYYATKAYVLSFSEALWAELRPYGVRVTALCPGPTATEFADRSGLADSVLFRPGSARVSDSARVAAAGWRALARGRRVVVPGLPNRAYAAVSGLVPRRPVLAAVGRINDGR